MEIIDKNAIKYNQVGRKKLFVPKNNSLNSEFSQILNQVRAFSLALTAVGSLLFLSTMLLPPLIGVSLNCFSRKPKDQTLASFFNERSDSDSEAGSKFYVKCDKNDARRKGQYKGLTDPIEDNISKIPILEEIQSVQPERERDESILTSEGFAKIH